MAKTLKQILEELPHYQEKLLDIREILLANAVMVGEIPAPTGGEEKRIQFLMDRLTEADCKTISRDEAGNGVGIHPGTEGEGNILVLAHADTPFAQSVDHAMAVKTDVIEGPGIGDNSLGLATIASLPTILEKLGIQLKNNLVLLGATKGLGHGNMEGLRFFLDHMKVPVDAGICVEGCYLGRLSYHSLGLFRGTIECKVPSAYDFSRVETVGAIPLINRVISSLLAIPLPRQPRTNIILGSINGGTGYNQLVQKATLRFEIRSEEAGMVSKTLAQIEEIIEEINLGSSNEVTLTEVSRRAPGSIPYAHPLVKATRKVQDTLGIDARIAPSMGELTALLERKIPGITLGLTRGEHLNEFTEYVEIEPIFKGLAQLIGVILAIDEGLADEPGNSIRRKTHPEKS